MSPRTGRPKAVNPKSVDVKVRFDEIMYDSLQKYCKEHSITRAEAIRLAVEKLLGKK